MEVEWESTITIPVDREEFEATRASMNDWMEFIGDRKITADYAFHVDSIVHFDNGLRIAERVVQRKTVNMCDHILGIYNGVIYPIVRTRAIETVGSLDDVDYLRINKITTRIILPNKQLKRNPTVYDSCMSEDEWSDDDDRHTTASITDLHARSFPRIRKSVNEERTEDGARYTLECEIEYPANTEHSDILMYEKQLMEQMQEYRGKLQADELTLQKIFSCVVPKVQMWNNFDKSTSYMWAYKLNGVKGKFMCIGDNAYIWPDAGEICTERCTLLADNGARTIVPNCPDLNGALQSIRNMCIQVEIMNDSIVIVEIVAVSYFDAIYYPEPLVNVEMLTHLKHILCHDDSTPRVSVGNKPLSVQVYHESELPDSYDRTRYDGFIIVQNNLLIKWKCPTVDVCYVGSEDQLSDIDCDEPSGSQTNGIRHGMVTRRDNIRNGAVARGTRQLGRRSYSADGTRDRELRTVRRVRIADCIVNLPDSVFTLDGEKRIEPKVGSIYELSSNMKILRRRTDRLAPSTRKEFNVFLKSVTLLNEQLTIDRTSV